MNAAARLTRTMEENAPHEPEVKVVDRRWWAQKDAAAAAPTGAEPTAAEQAAWTPRKPSYVEELERRLADKDQEIADLISKYRQAAREFDDSRARLKKDLSKEIERGRRTMLVELLEVVDNLDRAIDAARGAGDLASLLRGVEMIRELFLAKLDGFGVKRLDPTGEPFDAARHEALTTVPTDDPSQDRLVVGLLAPGYLVGGEVLRPARVAVAQFCGPTSTSDA